MEKPTVTIERRKHRRLQGKDSALVSLGSEIKRMWHLVDISEGGLAFRYLSGMEEPLLFSELVLLTKETSFYLEKLPFTIAADLEMNGRFLLRYTFRRCGVRFGNLTADQSAQMQYFMSKFAISPPLGEKARTPRPEERGRMAMIEWL